MLLGPTRDAVVIIPSLILRGVKAVASGELEPGRQGDASRLSVCVDVVTSCLVSVCVLMDRAIF